MTTPKPPLVAQTEVERKARDEMLAGLSEDYKRDYERRTAASQRLEDAKKATERSTPENKAARMNANAAIRRKLHKELQAETDPMKRRALEVQIDAHKEPRLV